MYYVGKVGAGININPDILNDIMKIGNDKRVRNIALPWLINDKDFAHWKPLK